MYTIFSSNSSKTHEMPSIWYVVPDYNVSMYSRPGLNVFSNVFLPTLPLNLTFALIYSVLLERIPERSIDISKGQRYHFPVREKFLSPLANNAILKTRPYDRFLMFYYISLKLSDGT